MYEILGFAYISLIHERNTLLILSAAVVLRHGIKRRFGLLCPDFYKITKLPLKFCLAAVTLKSVLFWSKADVEDIATDIYGRARICNADLVLYL